MNTFALMVDPAVLFAEIASEASTLIAPSPLTSKVAAWQDAVRNRSY